MSAPDLDGPTAQLLDEARGAVLREAAAVAAVAEQLDAATVQAVQWLHGCSGKVFVTGAGTSGAVARRMAHLLAVCGTPAMWISAADGLHGTMGAVTPGDVVIAISRGGGSAEINGFVARVAERGARVVALTAAPDSELGRHADLVVRLETPRGADPGEVIAMGSTLTVAVWGDAVAYVLMRLRGYGWEAVLHSHPSGAVGQLVDAPEPLPPLVAPWPSAGVAAGAAP